jgi:hypothetical protein
MPRRSSLAYVLARLVPAAALFAAAACGGTFKKTFGVKDSAPAHVEPSTTSVLGTWVLATPADSTAFAGATSVELTMQPARFSIVAAYPSGDAVNITGAMTVSDAGLVTLTPESGSQRASTGMLVMTVGRPISLRASAAGNTLVFAAPQDNSPDPSSVWHKKAASIQAGPAKP